MVKCKLCDQEGLKMAASHIIPKSMYASTLHCSVGPAKIISYDKKIRPARIPKGVYDKDILCIDCEASFSDWDSYAYDLFFRTEPTPTAFKTGVPQAGVHEKIELFKLQMFFISLVWRMQITTKPMFGNMRLGNYEERFKTALLEKTPNNLPEFDVIVSKFDHELGYGFLGPTTWKIEGVNGYRVCFAGHACWVKVDKRHFPEPFKKLALSNGNPFHILFRDFDDSAEKRAMIETVLSQK